MTSQQAPCCGQTQESVTAWLREHVVPGAKVAIRHGQGGLLHYVEGIVGETSQRSFEVKAAANYGTSLAGPRFYFSGKNARHPKGQTRIVIPTPAVVEAYGQPGDLGLYYGPFSLP